jgi:antirestriction protein ArdC
MRAQRSDLGPPSACFRAFLLTRGAAAQPAYRAHQQEEPLFANTKATIRHGGGSAYYGIDRNIVQMLEMHTLRDSESYYATLAHEATHWTRHPSRLNRDLGRKRFGDAGYTMEER